MEAVAVVDNFLPRVEPLVGEEQEDMAHRDVGEEGTGVLRKTQEEEEDREDPCKSYFQGEVEQPLDKAVVGSHCMGVPCLEREVASTDLEPHGEEAVHPQVWGVSSAEVYQQEMGVAEEAELV